MIPTIGGSGPHCHRLLRHCGWNSTLKAFRWWQFHDQSTNAKFVMDVRNWKMEIRTFPDEKNIVRHEDISRCVKLGMERDEKLIMQGN